MRLTQTRWHELGTVLALVGLVFGLVGTAAAQSRAGTGQIVGTVLDATGAAIPGAKVSVANKDTGLMREIETNEAGYYLATLLPPGHYTVTVKHPGFKTFRADVEVTVGAAVTLDSKLTVGEVSQVVEVTASSMIESSQPEPAALINDRSIAQLPINGRRFHDFALATPTVQVEPQRSQISFGGQRGINSNITIDGVDYNEPFFGGIRGGERAGNAFTIPQEAIAQFQIVPYGYSAEFGRSTGGLMNAVTKSGTNDWHGSGYYNLRHKGLAKKDALNRRAITSQHQFGGSVGGPIVKDKSFFFFAIEDQKNDTPRQVLYTRLDNFTPTTGQLEAFCFYRADPNFCTGATGLEGPFKQTNDAITFLGRWDQQFSPRHRVAVRYHYSKNTGENATATGDSLSNTTNSALSNNGKEGDRTNNVIGTWTGIFSPRVVNELRGGYSREDRPRLANSMEPGINNSVGNTGTRSFLSTTLKDWRVQIADNATWTMGRHIFRFGGEFNHLFVDQFFKFNQFGIFTFQTSDVGKILSILSLDPTSTTDHRFNDSAARYSVNIGNGQLKATLRQLAFFGQDEWRITPRLTLSAAFRWEGYINPNPDTSNTTLTNEVKNLNFLLGRKDPEFIPDNYRQYMPRLGIAWDPTGHGRMVIRAHAGFYYAHTPLLLFAAPLNNYRLPAGDLSLQLPLALPKGFVCTPIATGDNCATVYWQLQRIGINMDTIPLALGGMPTLSLDDIQKIATALGLANPDPFFGAQPITMADNYETPRSWQWAVGGEHELRTGWKVGYDFVYINTIHLERDRDFNLPTPLICAPAGILPTGCTSADLSLRPCYGVVKGGPCTQSRPLASLSSVTIRQSNARSLYRGFTMKSEYRAHRFQFQAYYTISKNTSDDDNERLASGFDYQDDYNLKPEYNFSRLDVRHLFAFNGLWDLPFGFTLSGLMNFRSARPFDASTASDSNTDNNRFSDRPFRDRGVPFLRNAFRDRTFSDVSIRIAKHFKLPREGMKLDLNVDLFNLFDFANVTYFSASGKNLEYGVGVDAKGNIVPPKSTFRLLRNPASCLDVNSKGNNHCYDTNNEVGQPFKVQVGMRFQF